MNDSQIVFLKSLVRNVPDFPVKGIQFKDLTPMFKNPKALRLVGDGLAELYRDKGVTLVAGIESRGFIGASMMATRLGAGFVPIRKPGKLPADILQQSYQKEYGVDTIEVHADSVTSEDVVVIHDDLLATGGTMLAAYQLIQKMRPAKVYINFLCAIPQLNGRLILPDDVEVTTLFDF